MSGPVGDGAGDAAATEDTARRLFRYVAFEEWRDYRAIMATFAGTFFSEFSPEEVTARLWGAGVELDGAVVADRLESLRGWGNLTVSSSVGSPTSLADYYKRRNRYLITRAGREVHDAVEGVLSRVDEVRDVSTGRLRALRDALAGLAAVDVARADAGHLADLVRAVFDPHEAFTSEITQFFAAINQWQSRYDLTPEEFTFFAEVLVGYVAERLDEIERTSRPIGRSLVELGPRVPTIVERANRGLAARVEEAGLGASVTVARAPGSTAGDWALLAGWFVGEPGRPSRITQLGADAVSAIRTLTLNLTRLSRVGIGASSRRADFLRLARLFDSAPGAPAAACLAAAAFGLYPSQHLGVLAEDAEDPVSTATSWAEAPRAMVPVSLRERGDTTNRGKATPMADRSQAHRALRLRREREVEAARRVDAELLAVGELDGAELSTAALARLQLLVGGVLAELGVRQLAHERVDGSLRCRLERTPGSSSTVLCPEGQLTLVDLRVRLSAAEVVVAAAAAAGAAVGAAAAGAGA
ncbi:MAG: TIGR02677 family protein, partial [Acidimicrobiia bacterium]|nr:TIGR02677 family protein [Acidimicrobiia bacterium]